MDLSQITLPNGDTYSFKDATARNSIPASLPASSGGTDLSLVTTGEKYTWNNSGVRFMTEQDIREVCV